MTEIPEHLLQRTRSRRQALGLPVSGDDGGSAPAAPAGGGAVATTGGGAAALPKGPVAPSGPVETAKAAPKPVPEYVQAYRRRRKIPIWAMPAVAALPVWGFLYAGTLEPAPVTELDMLAEGAVVYGESCASCHGPAGGGGVGPALTAGAVLETFPSPVDHVRWVVLGSAKGTSGGTYGANAKPSKGGMPNFGGQIPFQFIVDTVRHERETLSGEEMNEEKALEWGKLVDLAEDPDVAAAGVTEEQIVEALEKLSEETGFPHEAE
ncbi:MAG: cytochrome c [Acidimicrobiia bacterium]|nr:cytochrome c [Acidimicrobiia bacterium]